MSSKDRIAIPNASCTLRFKDNFIYSPDSCSVLARQRSLSSWLDLKRWCESGPQTRIESWTLKRASSSDGAILDGTLNPIV